MVVTTDRVLQYARDSFECEIDDLLDDPSNLLHPWRDKEPPEEIAEYRQLAIDLGFDFDELLLKHGHEHDIKRLRDIESGDLQPLPRECIHGCTGNGICLKPTGVLCSPQNPARSGQYPVGCARRKEEHA